MFNALKYTQELEKAGFSRDQAEASLKLLIEVMNENFATKSDLKELEFALRADMKQIESSLRSDIKQVETCLQSNIKELEYRMTIKLGTMMTIGIGVMATLIKTLQGVH